MGYVIRFRVYISQGVVEGRMMMLGIQRVRYRRRNENEIVVAAVVVRV